MKTIRILRSRSAALFILSLLAGAGGWAQSPKVAPSPAPDRAPVQVNRGEPLAIVAGQAIYEDDLQPQLRAQLRQLRAQEYKLKSQALERVVNQKILEAEAKKKGIPVDTLLATEVDSKVAEPSEAEVQAFYLGQKERPNRGFDEVKAQFQQALLHAKVQQARQEYLIRLREKNEVSILLHPPKVEVGFDPGRLRGDPKAPITIVEFSDFQCPYCKKVQPTLADLLTKYEGRVNLAFRDFPMRDIHSQAELAAEASRCAGEQGKFWEYHDLLFANREKLGREDLMERARTLRLDEKPFDSCLASGKYKAQIEADVQDGMRLGVNGTPGFFIGGVMLDGAQPAAEFEKIIRAQTGLSRHSPTHP